MRSHTLLRVFRDKKTLEAFLPGKQETLHDVRARRS